MQGDRGDFIVAEIPALVEGSHLVKGLGNEFLRQAQRTKLLIYLLDGSSPTLIDDLNTLDKEMALYTGLSRKPKIVAVNKIDLPEVQARLPAMKQCLASILSGLGVPVFYISAAGGQGVLELTRQAMEMVAQVSVSEEMIPPAQPAVFRPKPRK
jgi:GTP-binding protein